MKIVVDTNVLITFFWKQSVFRTLLLQKYFDAYAPEYALEEINDHQQEICKKCKLTQQEFSDIRTEMAIYVEFIPLQEYKKSLTYVSHATPDSDDVDFLALAHMKCLALWSNDKILKKQKIIQVLSTRDILENPQLFTSDDIE